MVFVLSYTNAVNAIISLIGKLLGMILTENGREKLLRYKDKQDMY
jgi:mannitol/fructose-specific phosphotransferase system IIA component (Ntr-type)